MRKTIKRATMLALLTGVMQFGGCGFFNWGRLVEAWGLNLAYEFVLDNDAVFDLFEDGAPPA